MDMVTFGVGVALAAAAGALAPDFLVYPENGAISTFKGFEIIVLLVVRPTGLVGERERTA